MLEDHLRPPARFAIEYIEKSPNFQGLLCLKNLWSEWHKIW